MALTRTKKDEVMSEIADLLANSKMTVIAAYKGTSVKAFQELRKLGKDNGTKLKVVKNRIVIKAIESTDSLKNTDTSELKGMLLYAFNNEDEVAPAQMIASFAKKQPTLEFVGAISREGKFLSKDEVSSLALLPGKNELIAQVLATLASPTNDVMSGLAGNLHALLDGIEAKAAN